MAPQQPAHKSSTTDQDTTERSLIKTSSGRRFRSFFRRGEQHLTPIAHPQPPQLATSAQPPVPLPYRGIPRGPTHYQPGPSIEFRPKSQSRSSSPGSGEVGRAWREYSEFTEMAGMLGTPPGTRRDHNHRFNCDYVRGYNSSLDKKWDLMGFQSLPRYMPFNPPPWYVQDTPEYNQGHPMYLCRTCRHIDLEYLFNSSNSQRIVDPDDYIRLGPMQEIANETTCSLCKLISVTIASKLRRDSGEKNITDVEVERLFTANWYLSPFVDSHEQYEPGYQLLLRPNILKQDCDPKSAGDTTYLTPSWPFVLRLVRNQSEDGRHIFADHAPEPVPLIQPAIEDRDFLASAFAENSLAVNALLERLLSLRGDSVSGLSGRSLSLSSSSVNSIHESQMPQEENSSSDLSSRDDADLLIDHNERVTEWGDSIPEWYIETPRISKKEDPAYLCPTCRHIDLDYIFWRSKPQQYIDSDDYIFLGSLNDMLRKQQCGLCRLVAGMALLEHEQNDEKKEAAHKSKATSQGTQDSDLESKYYLSPAVFTNDQTGPSFQLFLRRDIFDVVGDIHHSDILANGAQDASLSNLGIRIISNLPRGGRRIPDEHLDFEWIKKTIELCEISSEHPAPYFSHPVRIIDVTEMCIITAGPTTRYVTLSYAWGSVKQPKFVRRDTIKRYQERGSLSHAMIQLPMTIQDAITLVQKIGERYLWVDCMCILQDDSLDFKNQINQMNEIYRCSLFTIHAAAGNDANHGLPGVRLATRNTKQIIEQVGNLMVTNVLLREDDDDHAKMNSAWRARAWTYQERVLSQRHLYVTDGIMSFNCMHVNSPEDEHCWHKKEPNLNMIARGQMVFFEGQDLRCEPYLTDRTHFDTYALMVSEYSRRNLTFQSDAAVAFTGVMQELERWFGRRFIHGLPEAELDAGLLWSPTGASVRRSDPSSGNFLFPSWSWLGWIGHAAYPWDIERTCFVSTTHSPLVWRNSDQRSPSIQWFTPEDQCLPPSPDRARIIAKLRARNQDHLGLWKSSEKLRSDRGLSNNPAVQWLNRNKPSFDYLSPGSSRLTFRTLSASFIVANRAYRRKKLYNMIDKVSRLTVFDSSNYIAGYIDIPDPETLPNRLGTFPGRHEFIALSRSTVRSPTEQEPDPLGEGRRFVLNRKKKQQRAGAASKPLDFIDKIGHFDTRIYDDERPWCLFNVMMIERKQDVAYRVAIGRIHVDAFLCASPVEKVINLE